MQVSDPFMYVISSDTYSDYAAFATHKDWVGIFMIYHHTKILVPT
jgi:hypothetical protein